MRADASNGSPPRCQRSLRTSNLARRRCPWLVGFRDARSAMTVTFQKRGRCCAWSALRPPRSIVPGPTMAAGADIPHDLHTFVIESALGVEHGFWGCVADGARFKSLGRKRTPQGRALIARYRDDLVDAERMVNDVYFAWRAGRPTPVDRELDEMLERWQALPDGGQFTLEWRVTRLRVGGVGVSIRGERARPRFGRGRRLG